MITKITKSTQESALDTAGRHREQKNEKRKSKTKKYIEEKERNTTYKYEYAEICKTIRKLFRDDIRDYNTIRVKEAVGEDSRKSTAKKTVK